MLEAVLIERVLAKRRHLKKMLAVAKTLPVSCPGREAVIARLEAEILYIKLDLNCAY